MKYTKFGEYFRVLRIKHNEVLADAKEFLHVSAAFISSVELGKRAIPKEWFNLIAEHYNLDKEEQEELRNVIEESTQNIKIDLKNSTYQKRELAIQFQRSFDNLDDETTKRIMKILVEEADN